MTVTEKINQIIIEKWNPGECFYLQDILTIARNEGITSVSSTIRRTLQEIRDRKTIKFVDNKGTYIRSVISNEIEGKSNSMIRSVSVLLNNSNNDDSKKRLLNRIVNLLNEDIERPQLLIDIKEIEEKYLETTEKRYFMNARLGQGDFRKKLIKYWSKCSMTGCNFLQVLKASHIKPWKDSNDVERLDVYNGFLLIPNLDSLFDAGLVTVLNTGVIQLSSVLRYFEISSLGIPKDSVLHLEENHYPYLEYHRKNVFIK